MSITPITRPLPGERVVALWPDDRAAAAATWLRRPNLFPGRTLTAPTLDARAAWQAGHVAERAQAFTTGVVRGLEVGTTVGATPEGGGRPEVRVRLGAGLGLAVGGEDVVLLREVEADLWGLPVAAPPGVFEGEGFGGGGVLQPRAIGPTLGALLDAFPDVLPHAGVLVLQPVSVEHADIDADDPCDRCGCDDDVGFEDWRRADAARLLWYAWPEDWRPLPPENARFRNHLAWTVFEAERRLGAGEVLPWEEIGLPVALVGVDDAFVPTFADRHAVVRQGGRARAGRLLLATGAPDGVGLATGARMPGLWQAQIEQLAEQVAEQVAELGDPAPAPDVLAAGFDRLPPFGLLPRGVIDLAAGSSAFFPGGFDLDAVPVPVEQLDVALRASAALAPLDLARGERVRVLVPVTQASWEPRLLLTEEIDPEFGATLERFLIDRGRALAGRQSIRVKSAVLVDALRGEAPPVPAIGDDPEALEPETLGAWGPPEATSGHRSPLAVGTHGHGFSGASASARITPGRGELLYAWVYLDPDNPPRALMLEWRSGRAEHRAYWGENLIDRGSEGRVTRLRMGDLPEAGRWIRLEVKAAAMEFEDTELDGMGFVLYDGQAAFGPSGSVSADGEVPWFAGVPPEGAGTAGEEPFSLLTANELLAPFEAAHGVIPDVSDPDAPSGVSAALGELAADPRLTGLLSGAEQAQLPERGMEGFIAYLTARADRADDLVDYGFLKVQTDIYRVRQLVLGTTDATRLAVSPTLAGIARAETAVASNESISTFFGKLRGSEAGTAAAASEVDAGSSAGGGGTRGNVVFNAVTRVSQPLVSFVREPTAELSRAIEFPTATEVVRAQTKTSTPFVRATTYTPSDITNASPLVGRYDVRTLSIAERLDLPKAQEARDYATVTRHEAVLGLVRLADRLVEEDGEVPGLFEDIDVWGLDGDEFVPGGEDPVAALRRPLRDFIARDGRATLLAALLRPPMRDAADEAAQFSDSADLADRTVALLRQVEGRVKRYREAIAACDEARGAIAADLSRLGTRERDWAIRLAEARHDVAVTRALIAEEQARLDRINARRAEILEREVRFVAYVRPRTADVLESAASRTLDPGLLEAPAPACLRAEEEVPDELRAMLAVAREAPADWYRLQTRLLDGLDRVDLLLKAVSTARSRAQLARARTSNGDRVPSIGRSAAIGKVHDMQRRRMDVVRGGALQLDVARLAGLSWKGVRAEAAKVVSLGDLMEGEHGQGAVARNAAAFFERFGRICGCLHAAFSDVPPALRLDWSETLSQFDDTPNLRNLSTLSRWSEIDYAVRRRLQGLADWLFDQVDPREGRAQALVSDVVRMCLLLASHAPVGRIIAGRVPRPVTARPGLRVPLVALDPSRLRVGMQALVYRADAIVARAVVEDIGQGEASARVTHAAGSSVELDENVRVHFADAAEVGFALASSPVGRA
jgi:hypothetical protein